VTALGVPGASAPVTASLVADDASILPSLVELGPADGTTNINAGTQLFARFNQRMQAGVAGDITVRVNGSPVNATKTFSDGGRFVLVTPAAPLPFGSSCQIEVAAGALDTDGQALANGGQATFTVQTPPALALRNVSPPSGPLGASIAINGEGFSPTPALNTVRINGAAAAVTSATLTSLVCEVPANATSGPLTVEVGGTVSASLGFLVLTGSGVGGALGDLPAAGGIRDIAVTPDGSRVYVTNPSLNTVSALQVADAINLGNITVGLQPQGVAITPDGLRAYVANTGSNDVSVIVTDPAGAGYNAELRKIPVGPAPLDVAISGTSKVVVVNSGDGTLSVIDGNPANVATYDRVTATVNCGAGGQAVAISADGTRAYVAVTGGLAIVDLVAGAVSTTVNCGAAGQAVAISADNTLAFVLTSTGELKVIQLSAGQQQFQVVTSVNCGAGGQSVAISADGTRAFVTLGDGATVLVFEIKFANGAQNSSIIPGPAVRLVPATSIPVGEGAAGMAVDVSGVPRMYVANSVAGTVTIIGFPEGLPTLAVEFTFASHSLNLKSMGRWVKGVIEPEPPAVPEDILLASIRLNGVVGVDSSGSYGIGDADQDGLPDLTVRFRRAEVELVVATGDDIPVTVTGLIGPRLFSGTDLIKVKRGGISAPPPHAVLQPGAPYTVQWTTPTGVQAQWVQIAHSFDHGATWTLDATRISNTGSFTWNVPNTVADSALVAVAIVEEELNSVPGAGSESAPGAGVNPESEVGDNVVGVLAMSGYFRIFGTTLVEPLPVALQFAPIQPNPARSAAHLRFGLPQRTDVSLEVFDLQGRRIKTLARGVRAPGWHEFDWTGRDDQGGAVDAGLYFVRFKAAGREMNQRLVWLR
ncbi:MAG: Ig-like domain-containing protein, partial [Candidatus Eisenbacteria bacterium]